MVVHISLKPSGSNKTIDVPYKLIAYQSKDQWYILTPKVDYISFTYNIPLDDQDAVKQALWDLPKEDGPFSPAKKKVSRYKTRVNLTHPASGKSVLIEADPKPTKDGKMVPFLRFQFNPDKLGPDGMAFMKERLEYAFSGNYPWKAIAINCKVTRIDLAIDILNVPIDQLLISSSKAGKSHCYYSATGVLETAYLEVKSGKAGNTYAYNKNQQLMDMKRNPKYDGVPHTRIELRVRTSRSIVKLGALPNPFTKLNIAYPSLVGKSPEQPHNWQHLLDSVRYRGRKAALALIPDDSLREAYEDALTSAQGEFWKPRKLWKKWPDILKGSGLLPTD